VNSPAYIFRFIETQLEAGRRVALVTVIRVTGASVRNPGAHMAVAENGEFRGSLSGGCIEAAVVAEALETIRSGAPRTQIYGAGSSLIDIRLPCGGTVELLFSPLNEGSAVISSFESRVPARLDLVMPGNRVVRITHAPPLRLTILGHGATVEALSALASSYGAIVSVITPDAEIASRAGGAATLIHSVYQDVDIPTDPWTAVVFLFHDHDWETELLSRALERPSLMTGAMGSNKTHAARLDQLRARGVSDETVTRIKAPIGLIPSSRDPETLALSILAEAVAAYNAAAPTTLEI
jgi:xanthine dehydrogenase accessory factor